MKYIQDLIKSVGEERATLKRVQNSEVNRWGDADTEITETQVSAVFEIISAERNENVEGDFNSGDLRAYIPNTFDGVDEGNRLEYQGREYEIDEVIEYEIQSDGHYEVLARRV